MAFFEGLTFVAAGLAALLMLMVFSAARGAPQEAAGAAMAAAVVIIPYCVARILQGRAILKALQRRDAPPAD